jgi:hypothetical protein
MAINVLFAHFELDIKRREKLQFQMRTPDFRMRSTQQSLGIPSQEFIWGLQVLLPARALLQFCKLFEILSVSLLDEPPGISRLIL